MVRMGIVCALRSEARWFVSGKLTALEPVEVGEGVLLILSGMGRERARLAGLALAETGADCLLGFGAAGALAPALRAGDLVVASEVIEAGRTFSADADLADAVIKWLSGNNSADAGRDAAATRWLSGNNSADADRDVAVTRWLFRKKFAVHNGLLACAAGPVASVADKRDMFAQTGALAVDMESAGVFDAAQRSGLPAAALRVIIDAAHVALPDAVLRRVDEFGEVDGAGLALELARSPGQIPAVARLACAARRAGATMKQVAGLGCR